MKSYKLKFFIDFDGTVSKNDIWINSLGKFAKDRQEFQRIANEFHSGKISGRETIKSHLELIEDFSFERFNSYLDAEEIDEHFRDFVHFCSEKGYEIHIVSAGFDYYINYILEKNNIDLNVHSCILTFDEHNRKIGCEFVHSDEYCTSCETCKRNILINFTNDLDNEISVFIGDSDSDFCVSGFADMVFAKGRLASYCWKNNITYFDYQNFSDIKNKITKLTQKRIRHRQEAGIKRRDVLMGG